jgi:hypothetical protein
MKTNGQYHYQGQSFDSIALMRDYILSKPSKGCILSTQTKKTVKTSNKINKPN